ncbi:MAG: Cell division-specific peptidoglycan biosynthesis regulator FtsW [candidate division WS6 bacterium GW2011_GWC1_36_11]|uniref:Probable peptidoglycan glycosyltransferase FtsW n=2 Tax=Candidatus Dojkabacteria TaxID=74243 RepID=A0A0G0DEQ8_9BACT|nr:MAG: Cell division-specific peptidoglycan biosynthesis regulator FtsW [candidate division WS6 bacterium GW2011_GWC1_36_11]KKQ04357.1 MAG: Cell division-specific peptidoglycan biosynthesis regulator FtsW [candidate division WS6 bacterium GW2011_WS6_36_26]KKQ11590.1 MAG: Cell division-specific peptidoglycan biosynthesis regulator FtsW [candidate division WS6 bacterium GW2011_GWC2_36_7]
MSNPNTVQKRRTKNILTGHKPDSIILIFAIMMAIFGAIMIFDASVYQANTVFNDQFYFLKSQLVWLVMGIIPAVLIYFWDYRKILKLAFPALIITIVLLVLVLVLGEALNGSKRWFAIGSLPKIQPAEFAKITLIMYLSSWLAKRDYKYKDFKSALREGFVKNLLGFLAILGTVAVLILLEPDLGTTMILCITCFIMFLMAGEDRIHTLASGSVLLLLVPVAALAAILEPYRLKRVMTFMSLLFTGKVADPQGSGYQMQQILIGIGSGGIFGTGFGQSRQRFGYLVENTAFTDSIFAVILEELGFLGGTLIIIAWLVFLWRGLKIAMGAPDKQGRLLAAGITVWLVMQTLLNIAANVGFIPLTGMPIPLLSYGGSSTIVSLIGIGILLNISKYSNIQNGQTKVN